MKAAATLGLGVLALTAVMAAGAATVRVVTTTHNAKLGKTILVTKRGLSLYSLSVERHGRFVCKNSACLALWIPLRVQKGTKPAGIRGLATIKRPDHTIQVTYRGEPLYRFYLDHKRGDIQGNGFRDVGTWRVVVPTGH